MSKHTISKRQQNQNSEDSLLVGYKWNKTTINYDFCISSIPTVNETGVEQVENKIISPLDTAARFRPIFLEWESVTNMQFFFNSNNPDLCIARGDFIDPQKVAGLTVGTTKTGTSITDKSQIYLSTSSLTEDYSPGAPYYQVAQHEAGHSLGLWHPFYDKNFPNKTVLHTSEDTWDFTTMSYTPSSRYALGGVYSPATPMLYDIAAAQSLYGANTTYMSGDTRYYVDGVGALQAQDSVRGLFALPGKIRTLWDAGGMDTLDLSAVTAGVTVDLREGLDPASDPQNTGKFTPYVTSFNDNRVFMAYGAAIENAATGAGDDVVYLGASSGVAATNNGNDVIFDGASSNTLQGGAGYDSYRFLPNHGHDTIDDTDQRGEIVFNGQPLTGVVQKSMADGHIGQATEQGRWLLKDTPPVVLTRTANGVASSTGTDLTLTVDEALQGAQDSVTLKNYAFSGPSPATHAPTKMGLGDAVQGAPVLANDGQAGNQFHPALCKLNDNTVAEVWLDGQIGKVNGKIYSLADGKVVNQRPFTVNLEQYPGPFKPSISAVGTDKFVVGYMDTVTPLDQMQPKFVAVKASVLGTDGAVQRTVQANQQGIDNINSPVVLGADAGFTLGFQYGFTGHVTPPTGEIRQYDLGGNIVGNSITKPVYPHFTDEMQPHFTLAKMPGDRVMYIWTGDTDNNGRSQLRGQAFAVPNLGTVNNEVVLYDGLFANPIAVTLMKNGQLLEEVIVIGGGKKLQVHGSDYSATPLAGTAAGGYQSIAALNDGGHVVVTAVSNNKVVNGHFYDAQGVGIQTTIYTGQPAQLVTSNDYVFWPDAVEIGGGSQTSALFTTWQASPDFQGVNSDLYTSIVSVPLPGKSPKQPVIGSNTGDTLSLNQDNVHGFGLKGDDTIIMAGNNNVASGGKGKDGFTVDNPLAKKRQVVSRVNTITDFDAKGNETINITGYAYSDWQQIPKTQIGNDTLVTLTPNDTLLLQNVQLGELGAANFIVNTVPVTPNAMPVNAPINTPTRTPVNTPVNMPAATPIYAPVRAPMLPGGNHTPTNRTIAGGLGVAALTSIGVLVAIVVVGLFACAVGGLYVASRLRGSNNGGDANPDGTQVEELEMTHIPSQEQLQSVAVQQDLEQKTNVVPFTDRIGKKPEILTTSSNVVPFTGRVSKPLLTQPDITVSDALDNFISYCTHSLRNELKTVYGNVEVKDSALGLINEFEGYKHLDKGAIGKLAIGEGEDRVSLDTLARGIGLHALVLTTKEYDPETSKHLQDLVKDILEKALNPQKEQKVASL